MDPDEIELKTINKLFEYEKQTRIIDNLDEDQLKIFVDYIVNYIWNNRRLFLLLDLILYKYILDPKSFINVWNKSQIGTTTSNKKSYLHLLGLRGLSLSELSDVNIQNLTGGELLIYDSVTNKWNSTKYLTSDPATAPDNDGNLPSNILGTNQIEINGGNF